MNNGDANAASAWQRSVTYYLYGLFWSTGEMKEAAEREDGQK